MLAIVVLLYSLVVVSVIVLKGVGNLIDSALMAFVTMLLVLQWVVAVKSKSKNITTENYVDDAYAMLDEADNLILKQNKRVAEELEDGNLADMPSGLVMYVSCFLNKSYRGIGKLFRNVAVTDMFPTPDAEKNMYFRVDPAFSRRDGSSMSANSLTGPLSYKLDIKGDLSFTTVVMCQFTGITTGMSDVIMQRIYANTPDNNGLCVFMKSFAPMSGNLISADMFVTFGSAPPFRCSQTVPHSPLLLDTNKKYMIVVSKGMGKLKVTIVDVGVHTAYDSQVVLDEKLTVRESVVFSNKEMMINNNENWNANIMSYAIFDRVLADTDIHDLYTHYTGIFRKMDPEYKAIMNSLKEVVASKACPFDAVTCNACASVSDFTDPKLIIASSEQCIASINTFCTANPSHVTCWCWDTKNPYYMTRCKAYRGMFSPQDVTSPQVVTSPQDPTTVVDDVDGMGQLLKYIGSEQITDGQGNGSLVSSLLSVLKKPGVGELISSKVGNPEAVAASVLPATKDAVQAMLMVLSDLKNTVPPTTNQAAVAMAIQSQQGQKTEETSSAATTVLSLPPTTDPKGKFSFVRWFFGMS